MTLGIRIIIATGAAWLWCCAIGVAVGADAEKPSPWLYESIYSASPSASSRTRLAAPPVSAVSIGGEMRVDYTYSTSTAQGRETKRVDRYGDLALCNTNLRLAVDVTHAVRASIKLNLNQEKHAADRQILAEAMVVMQCLGVQGLEAFAGQGRAPYGQDVTLGIIQSYNHTANRRSTQEGDIFLTPDPDAVFSAERGYLRDGTLPPMRPGQFDQAFVAGLAYQPDERWRAEIALFQPKFEEYEDRLLRRSSGSDVGVASRIWWRPVEDLTVEASAMIAHSSAMGRDWLRTDIAPGARTTGTAKAVSVGFDWRPADWRLFGEWQRGWDWNFTKGYRTDTVQLGASYEIFPGWRFGGMGEMLRIRYANATISSDLYRKLAFNLRYSMSPGMFILAEWGGEWLHRRYHGESGKKSKGMLVGVRLGWSF